MKFLCLKCEQYMAFEKVEAPEEGRLGVTFACPSCQGRFAMVTNPGETQLVSSLGVSLGGRAAPLTPLEMTRGTLKSEPTKSASMAEYLAARAAEGAAPAPEAGGETKGCPFSSMVQQMGLGGAPASDAGAAEPTWSEAARAQLERLPATVRLVLGKSIEEYARKHGYSAITPEVMDAAKRGADGIVWSAEATERLSNIPDFVRPMARKEIERLARARGATAVTGEAMDQAKHLFSMG